MEVNTDDQYQFLSGMYVITRRFRSRDCHVTFPRVFPIGQWGVRYSLYYILLLSPYHPITLSNISSYNNITHLQPLNLHVQSALLRIQCFQSCLLLNEIVCHLMKPHLQLLPPRSHGCCHLHLQVTDVLLFGLQQNKASTDIGITRDESAAEAVKKIAFYSPLSSALASIDSYTRDLLATWIL